MAGIKVYIPKGVATRLRERAEAEGLRLSSYIRRILVLHVKALEKKEGGETGG